VSNKSTPLSQTTRQGLFSGVVATATSLTTVAGFAISLAVLIFSGAASDELPRAAGAFAVAGGIAAIWLALRSKIVPVATTIQDGPGMVAVVLAADYVADERTQVVDVFVLLGVTTLLTGAALWLLGYLELGTIARGMPTTVIGGFIAGTGWLLVKGGFDVMTATRLGLGDIGRLFAPELGRFWLPGLVLGLLAWAVAQSDRLPPPAVGLITLAALVVFYGVALTTSSLMTIEADGWLIGPFDEASRAAIVSPSEVTNANWRGIVASVPGIAGIAGLAVVAMLLNVTGIATQSGNRVDPNHELRTAGVANIIAAPFGATPGFHSLGGTELMRKLGVSSRVAPCATGGVLILFGIFGVQLIGYVPRMIPGALLVFLGMSILQGWAKALRTSGNGVERALSISIVLVIAWMGILPGIAAGLIATCALFVLRYSRIDPVRIQGSGADHLSVVDRSPHERMVLLERGHRLAVLQLQGYLFFGSLVVLERKIRSQALGSDPCVDIVDAVVLDFAHVTGIEASATTMLDELIKEMQSAGVAVALSSLSDRVRRSMATGISHLDDHVYASLDQALEYCESRQLSLLALQRPASSSPRTRMALSDALYAQFERVRIEQGQVIARQGGTSDGIFVVERGSLTAYRLVADLTWHRLRQISELGIVGEVGLSSRFTHPAAVIADVETTALWLSNSKLHVLRRDFPSLTAELHEFILRQQTEQVIVMSEALAHTLR